MSGMLAADSPCSSSTSLHHSAREAEREGASAGFALVGIHTRSTNSANDKHSPAMRLNQ